MMIKNAANTSVPPSKRAPRLLTAILLGVGLLGGAVWWQLQSSSAAPSSLSGDFHALQVLGSGQLAYGQHAGVSISQDGGRSWSQADGAGDAMALAISPAAPQTLVMAGHDVLRISRDSGQNWQDAGFGNLPGTDIHGFAVAPGQPKLWYANIAGRGLYRTANGRDWRFVTPEAADAMQIAVGPDEAFRLYALSMRRGLLVSDDGVTWRPLTNTPAAASSGLSVHPVSGNVYLAGPTEVARSQDKGGSWSDLSLPEGALLITADPQDEGKLE